MLTQDLIDMIMCDEDIKPGESLRWHVRATDETGHDYNLGTVVAKNVGDAMKLAQTYWPDCGCYLCWAEKVELDLGEENGTPDQT